MFRAVMRMKDLRAVINAIAVITDDGRFEMSETGIVIKVVDPLHVTAMTARLGLDAFESFETTPGIIGVDVARLKDVLNMADSKDSTVVVEQLDDSDKLIVTTYTFASEMFLVPVDSIPKCIKIPHITSPVHLVLLTVPLKRAVKLMQKISCLYAFFGNQGTLLYITENNDFSPMVIKIPGKKTQGTKLGTSNTMIRLATLMNVMKGIGKTKEIQIGIGVDDIVSMSFTPGPGIDIEYLVAPWIVD